MPSPTLPDCPGDGMPNLVRLSAPVDALRADYRVMTHPDLSRDPSVRAVSVWVTDCFRAAEHAPSDTPAICYTIGSSASG